MMEKQAPALGEEVAPRADRELIAACLAGDAAAWEAIVARYQLSANIKLVEVRDAQGRAVLSGGPPV
ncbi:MAG TPA: hypothetical protein VKA60_06860 [Blastocatellia bacterium]|nr:hypothetical protein [Blastocatellia bacterium]